MFEPLFEDYMLPILVVMKDGAARKNSEIRTLVLKNMGLNPDDLTARLKNGNFKYSANISFALSYLSMAGCLSNETRGIHTITKIGLDVISSGITKIDTKYLKTISPDFKERIERHSKNKTTKQNEDIIEKEESLNPEEKLFEAERLIKETIKSNILANLLIITPKAFEEVCRKFMLALGYGYDSDSGHTTQYSHDGGIDGFIYGDKLGLEKIAFQSKRYEIGRTVGRPEVSSFFGAIDKEYNKGVFITTSKFSKGAIDYARNHQNIKLIDGEMLCDLMYEYGIGVSTIIEIKIKALDSDFFNDLEEK